MTIENTVVELDIDVGRWPAGTRGTVVVELPGGVLIEISGTDGCTEDLIEAPDAAYRVVRAASHHGTQEFAAQ